MKPAIEDIENRRPVWEALSDLFLDTDTSMTRNWRAKHLATSPYSVHELEQILIQEVYPICKYNLFSVAGEWAGFDLGWLETQILSRLNSSFRAFHIFNFGRFTVQLSPEWKATKTAIEVLRNGAKGHVA